MSKYKKKLKIKSHSCPFLNNNLGTDFKNYRQFEKKIHKFWVDKKYQPRKWIKKNYTLVKAANNLLNKLNIEYNQ